MDFEYEATTGRLATVTASGVTITPSYATDTGQLDGLVTSAGEGLAFEYDGFLPTRTTWSGSAWGSSWTIEAARTPSPPAKNVASSVLASASWFGDRPSSIAPISFSDAARVASPNRVKRYTSQSTRVQARTMPGRMNRSIGTFESNTVTVPLGRTGGWGDFKGWGDPRFGVWIDKQAFKDFWEKSAREVEDFGEFIREHFDDFVREYKGQKKQKPGEEESARKTAPIDPEQTKPQ